MTVATETDSIGKVPAPELVQILLSVAALKEYLEEQLPDTEAALQALNALRGLLKDMQAGKPIAGTEFDGVARASYMVFAKAGLILDDRMPSSRQRELCVPDWCIRKIYDGLRSIQR